MKNSLRIAWRLFRGIDRNAMVSFISAVSILGMALAVAVLVLVLSVMNGFEREFRDRILGMAPHASIRFDTSQSWDDLREDSLQHPDVVHVQPVVELQSMLMASSAIVPTIVQGIDYQSFAALLQPYVIDAGATTQESSTPTLQSNDIIISAKIAEKLSLSVGDRVNLFVSSSNMPSGQEGDTRLELAPLPQSQKVRRKLFRVSHIVATGTELDNGLALISYLSASELAGLGGKVSGIHIQSREIFFARQLAYYLSRQLDTPSRVTDWTRSFGNLYAAIQLSRQMVGLLIGTIIAVAVFNIVVTLGMLVKHKQADIAILRSMGMRRRGVLQVFVLQGLLIGFAGCAIGLVLGALTAWFAPSMVVALEYFLGIHFLDSDIYPIDYLPSEIRVEDLLQVSVAALTMSFIATLVPAWRASRLLPAQVLRES